MTPISRLERWQRNGHPGLTVWFTGLSGAGKTTLATALERRLFEQGRTVYRLDGDLLRTGLSHDLGYSAADRRENVRRAGEVARLMTDAGVIVLAALITPFLAQRDALRGRFEPGQFLEVYVNAPLSVCEQRDPKGHYRRARANLLADFTGIQSPYEAPVAPDLELNTDRDSLDQCLAKLEASLLERLGQLEQLDPNFGPTT